MIHDWFNNGPVYKEFSVVLGDCSFMLINIGFEVSFKNIKIYCQYPFKAIKTTICCSWPSKKSMYLSFLEGVCSVQVLGFCSQGRIFFPLLLL